MSTTTEILFNSPALHSLKRDQLVKLCKIHSIKASGKNVELIQKLRRHAKTLPKDSPLSIAARSESSDPIPVEADPRHPEEEEEIRDDASYQSHLPRQSEQWEMVMDSIQEEEEGSSQGTMSSQRTLNNGGTGEFGVGSSKSSSVGSSIKALATSFGLKRGNSKASTASSKHSAVLPPHEDDELALKSTPYSSLPEATSMPQTDHFTLDSNRMSIDGNAEVPLPGHALRPGIPAPANARLSMGFGLGAPATPSRETQPTTTIRLVANQNLLSGQSMDLSYGAGDCGTPQLKPFKTTFDLSFGSPAPKMGFGFGGTSVWPPRNDDDPEVRGIYPTLTFDDLPPSMPASPAPASPAPAALGAKSPGPFMFGSPRPENNVSDDQFRSAAASVLEEMNQRLREDGVDGIDVDIIAKLHPGVKKEPPREIKPIPGSKRAGGEITDKFQKMHDQEFEKMQGIDEMVRRRAGNNGDNEKVVVGSKRKSNALEREGGTGPRRPSAVAGRASATRVISNGRRAKQTIPGGFGMDDDDDEEDDKEQDRCGKRVRMDPEAVPATLAPEEQKKQDEAILLRQEELEKEKEAIRKKLEANRARRRSSAAHGGGPRKSVGRPRSSVLQKPKSKPSRFGFLSSAKSLVQNVWNRGKAAEPAPSNIPKPTPVAKAEPVKEKMGPPSFAPSKKASAAPARPTTATATASKPPSFMNNVATAGPKGSIASSSGRSRSPLPNFNAPNTTNSRNSIMSTGTSRTSRSSMLSAPNSHAGSIAGTAASSKSRPSSNHLSSVGTRGSSRLSVTDTVNSMGAKKTMSGTSIASRKSTAGSSSRLSVASRLLAPTASSLAKRNSTVPASSPAPQTQPRYQSPSLALHMITNSPAIPSPRPPIAPHGTFSPRPGGIFSQPLALPMQSSIPTPIKKRPAPAGTGTGAGASDDAPKPAVRSLNGRKPRISRSKVIARLASQREATGAGSGARVASGSSIASTRSGLAPRASGGGKTRSSLGAKVSRASYGGGTRGRPSAGGVVLSAKKRARQSEVARRRSRVGPIGVDAQAAK